MPVVSVHRYATAALLTNGAQYIDGNFTITSAPATKPVIALTQSLYSEAGRYLLFKYSGTFSGSLDDLSIDDTALSYSSYSAPLVHNTDKKEVYLTLVSRPTNGTQYVDGNLTINAGATFVMSDTLCKTAGTYILFDVTGTITGLSNLTVDPPVGRALDPAVSPNPFIDVKQIKVTLV